MILSEQQQLNAIRNQAIVNISVVDLDLNGYDVSSAGDFIKIGYQATKNKVLFWLNLQPGDIVRSGDSSPLLQLIGQTLAAQDPSEVEDMLKEEFSDRFSSEYIFLERLSVVFDNVTKLWMIEMVVMDEVSDSLIPINLEVIQ